DDREIARLHGEFLGAREPTDVLSFLIDDTAEIAVSVQTAARCARRHRSTLRAELALYVVHGVLHLCGFDDTDARSRLRMRAAEPAGLEALGLRVVGIEP